MALELKVAKTKTKASLGRKPSALFSLARVMSAGSAVSKFFGETPIKHSERMFFNEQLSLLLESGVSLQEALRGLQLQTKNPKMLRVLGAIDEDVQSGKSFSVALSRHPTVFSQTYVNLIAASETGGFMFQVLEELREMDERRERLNSTLQSALAYPVFLMAFSMAVVIFVLVVIFPKFSEMFSLIEDQLPLTTRVLMSTSEVFLNYWFVILLVFGASVLLIIYWCTTERGKAYLDHLRLKLPVIRHVYMELYLVQLMRVMSLSMSKGVSVMDTLASCRGVVKNHLFQQFIRDVELRVEAGEGISAGFSQADFIPQVVQQLVATGDQSGNLPRVLARTASYYERRLEKRLLTLSKAAEPLMLLVMGIVVGVLVSSLILPIFKLSRAVG